MRTANFQYGGIVGVVSKSNPQLDAFDAALYSQKLYKVYGVEIADLTTAYEVVTDDKGKENVQVRGAALMRPDIQSSITIFNAIHGFCEIAPQVIEFEGAPVEWVSAKASAMMIDD